MSGRPRKKLSSPDCWLAMDRLVNCAAKIIKGTGGATPGFCSHNIEVSHIRIIVWLCSRSMVSPVGQKSIFKRE